MTRVGLNQPHRRSARACGANALRERKAGVPT